MSEWESMREIDEGENSNPQLSYSFDIQLVLVKNKLIM
jgi:hypothetical protein